MRIIAILLLTATAAQAVEQARVDLLLKLVRENGCQLNDATASRVLPANGFTKSEVSQIEKVLDGKGMIDKSKMGVFALTKSACKS